jgi:hypothetical protein
MALMTDIYGKTAEFQSQWSVIYWNMSGESDATMTWHSNYYELTDAQLVTTILRKEHPEWMVKIIRYVDY